jgi:hypothetical protein
MMKKVVEWYRHASPLLFEDGHVPKGMRGEMLKQEEQLSKKLG